MEIDFEFWINTITTLFSLVLVIFSFIYCKKKSKTAKSEEEKNEANEILMTNLSVALTNIKNTLTSKNIKVSNKAIKQAFKETMKGEEENNG